MTKFILKLLFIMGMISISSFITITALKQEIKTNRIKLEKQIEALSVSIGSGFTLINTTALYQNSTIPNQVNSRFSQDLNKFVIDLKEELSKIQVVEVTNSIKLTEIKDFLIYVTKKSEGQTKEGHDANFSVFGSVFKSS